MNSHYLLKQIKDKQLQLFAQKLFMSPCQITHILNIFNRKIIFQFKILNERHFVVSYFNYIDITYNIIKTYDICNFINESLETFNHLLQKNIENDTFKICIDCGMIVLRHITPHDKCLYCLYTNKDNIELLECVICCQEITKTNFYKTHCCNKIVCVNCLDEYFNTNYYNQFYNCFYCQKSVCPFEEFQINNYNPFLFQQHLYDYYK